MKVLLAHLKLTGARRYKTFVCLFLSRSLRCTDCTPRDTHSEQQMGDATVIQDVLDLTVKKLSCFQSSPGPMTSFMMSPTDDVEENAAADRSLTPSSMCSEKIRRCSPAPSRDRDVTDRGQRTAADDVTVDRSSSRNRSSSNENDHHFIAGSTPKSVERTNIFSADKAICPMPMKVARSTPTPDDHRDSIRPSVGDDYAADGQNSPSFAHHLQRQNNSSGLQPAYNSVVPFLPPGMAASLPFNLNRLLAFQQLYAGAASLPLVSACGIRSALHPGGGGAYPNAAVAARSPHPMTPSAVPQGGRSTTASLGSSSSPSSTTAGDCFWPIGETTPQRKRKRATSDDRAAIVGRSASGPSVGDLSGAESNSSDPGSRSGDRHSSWPGRSASMTTPTIGYGLQRQSSTGDWQPDDVDDMSASGNGLAQSADPSYIERRRKNNEAAKRSRDARRNKERETASRAANLEQENMRLKAELAVLRTEAAKLQRMLFSRF